MSVQWSMVLVLAWGCVATAAEDPMAGAAARIEKHRKADATIAVVDAAGKPIAGAEVRVEQTRHAFLFGSNVFQWGKIEDPKVEALYRERFAGLLNYATLPFYWWMYEGERGKPQHERTEQVARWCKEHSIATKGHPLAWDYAEPRWLPADLDEVRRLQMGRIEDCAARFSGLIDRWDVVNEAVQFDREECLRRAPHLSGLWKKLGRVEFTRECFDHARKAAPKGTLLINDYRTDPAYADLIGKLVDVQSKPLYDVIGIQSHMHGGTWPNGQIWEVCERFAKFGVPLHFTEMTVLSGERGWERPRPWKSSPEGEAQQAKEVVRIYTMLFSHPAVEAITWWDLSDYRSWQGAPAGLIRADMSPKPAYDELLKLIKQQWSTRTTATTAGDGTAHVRGFLGEYRVTVTAGGKSATATTTLAKGENRWTVRVE